MRVGIVSVFVDYHRRGAKNRFAMQPQIGSLLAGLLPRDIEIEVINETSRELDFTRDYDLLFISALHPDFDRARQISHYYRRRGATTIFGGTLASSYPELVAPYFDAIVTGDPESAIPQLFQDFCRKRLQARYHGEPYSAQAVATPRFDLVAGRLCESGPLCIALEATRGCPFTCDFCVLTALGTRYETRPVDRVIGDIVAAQQQLQYKLAPWRRRLVGFTDNNLGGSLRFLRELCAALKPLRLHWYCAVTFNVISNPELVRLMAESGCICVFVGLESFNPQALADMHKMQNVLHKTRAALDCCRDHGILVLSGLMLSPQSDDLAYVRQLPQLVRESGLHVPTFLCFEAPIPGTPHFHRLAAEPQAFLPDALLRDFAGYTLVTRPRHAEAEEFVAAYRTACSEIYSLPNRLRKLADDVPRFLRGGRAISAVSDAIDMFGLGRTFPPLSSRSLLAGSDSPPPEHVPLEQSDFDDEAQRSAILDPWAVTDERGHPLAHWRRSYRPFHKTPRHTATPDALSEIKVALA